MLNCLYIISIYAKRLLYFPSVLVNKVIFPRKEKDSDVPNKHAQEYDTKNLVCMKIYKMCQRIYHGYVFRNLQHFAAKPGNFTKSLTFIPGQIWVNGVFQ